MSKLWAGRTAGEVSQKADDFNSSISFDQRMYRQDIKGSMAHAAMLSARGIITAEDCDAISAGLEAILADLESGALKIDPAAEDIHMFIEAELTQRIGDAGKRLHTARSRNDQVAVDLRLWMRDKCDELCAMLKELIAALKDKAAENHNVIMPGYTHMQRAQPVTFGHHMGAWCMMLMRDYSRIRDAVKRMNVSPLGSCALAGTTYHTDRFMTAGLLSFDAPCANSLDGVADRDYCVELASAFALCMTHLSRFSEELVLWSSWEFKFIEISDAYSTGSSIMPQKKNPDMAELVRGKTGRVYGDLMGLLTVLKGLPLAYNKDMQEDKEAIFDAADTLEMCLGVFTPMVATMKTLPENMRRAAAEGFINATDLADWLVSKGMPFRSAYKLTGQLVSHCIKNKLTLETLPLEEYKSFDPVFDETLYDAIDLVNCVERRISYGGTAPSSVLEQIRLIDAFLAEE